MLLMYITYNYINNNECPSCPKQNICPPQKECPNMYEHVTLKNLQDIQLNYNKLKKSILKEYEGDEQTEMSKALEIIMSGYVSIAQLDPRYYDINKNIAKLKVN